MTSEVGQSTAVLKNGGILAFSDETGQMIGCDAFNEIAVENLLALIPAEEHSKLVCLVSNQAQLERHVEMLPEVAYDLLDFTTKPLILILENPKGISKKLISDDQHAAFRVATQKFAQYITNNLRKPLVVFPLKDYHASILKGVNYVVNLPIEKDKEFSCTIIKLSNDGKVKIIKQ